ncbi:MAG: MBL fold metallo-hydrolase [Myxococcales bacterium]|nr:MBL fold metallo-hydrolase [Myxococcales bacterium]
MQIELVSHASVVLRTADAAIWTDPWRTSKVFNNSWTLLVPAAPLDLDGVDYLWISHEHPDHFNIPTLRALPDSFKRRVVVLFQANNSDKMFAALHQLGFPNTRALPHREIVHLRGDTRVYCYQVGQMDSCLAVLAGRDTALNINDAEAGPRDCAIIRADIGPARVVLNQFSLAGYGGEHDPADRLPGKARQILANMIANHRDLGAELTIPIASFVYFSSVDNAYMNAYANTPRDVADAFARARLQLAVLAHGDIYTVGQPHDNTAALRRYDEIYAELPHLPKDPVPPASLADISAALARLGERLRDRYPPLLLRAWLRPVTLELVDLGATIELDLPRGHLRLTPGAAPDVSLHAQPLLFALQHPFGLQTLGVSARLRVHANLANWRRHRILLSMYNAELYLRPRLLFTRRNLDFLRARLHGGLGQLRDQLARIRG